MTHTLFIPNCLSYNIFETLHMTWNSFTDASIMKIDIFSLY